MLSKTLEEEANRPNMHYRVGIEHDDIVAGYTATCFKSLITSLMTLTNHPREPLLP